MNFDESVCHSCGFANSSEVLFCRKCGTRTYEDSNEPEKVLVFPEVPPRITGISIGRIAVGLVGAFFFFAFLAIIIPNVSSNRHRPHAREKACYANMRVILGAVEMYNMDNTDMIDSLSDSDATDENGILVQNKYLKSPISRPESGCYYSGDQLSENGRIECKEHGTVEGPDDR